MSYVFLFYIFLSFVIATGGAYILFSSGRTLAALLYIVGVIILEIVYGTKWFSSTGDTQTTNGSNGPWPPSINVCPDFLSLYTDASGNAYCVDTVGVTTALPKWSGTVISSGSGTNVFNLQKDTADANARRTLLCTQAKTMQLTWEGVWDGATCLGGNPPLPAKVVT